MTHLDSSNSQKQDALSRILGVAATYGKVMLVGTAATAAISFFPGMQLPPELVGLAGGLGVEALGSLLDRVADADDFSDEEIRRELDKIQDNIDRLITRDYFDHVVSYLVQWQKRHDFKNDELLKLVSSLQGDIQELKREKQQAQRIIEGRDSFQQFDHTRLEHDTSIDSMLVTKLASRAEGIKLDFKRELYLINHPQPKVQQMAWGEFIKDILAIANGNVNTGRQTGYLVIGLGNELRADGSREVFDVGEVSLTSQQILEKVNAACEPPLPDLVCQKATYAGQDVLVVAIPFTPHIHELSRNLVTKNNKTYSATSVFLRRGEGIYLATTNERQELRAEKQSWREATNAPFILPQLDISTFTGRQTELNRLRKLLIDGQGNKVSSIVGLAGTGGIGKSALACHFATEYRSLFPQGVVGLRVDGKELKAVASEFVRSIGEEIDPEDERSAATIMQEIFAPRRMLLIFDNAETEQVRALLPGGDRCAVIITTRDRGLPVLLDVPENSQLDVSPLPDSDSELLLRKLIGEKRVDNELAYAHEIISLVGGLPLALQIVGASLRLRPGRSLQKFAGALREERERLSRLRVRGSEHLDVRASFAVSLEMLEPAETELFACLSVCAEDGFSLRSARAASNVDERQCQETLDYLYRLSLINMVEREDEFYVFHPLLRLFARELGEDRGLLADAAQRHASHWVDFVKNDSSDPDYASIITNNLGDILVAAEWLTEQKIDDYQFLIRLEPILQQTGYWDEASNLMARFLESAEQNQNWQAMVQLRIQQAKFLALNGTYSHALSVLTPCEKIIPHILPPLQERAAAMYWNMFGVIRQRQGNFDEAVAAFQRSFDISEKLGDDRGQAMVLNSLGGVLQRQGNFDDAVNAFQRSFDISEKLGDDRSLAMVLNSLGGVLQRQGNFDEAVAAFQRSFDLLVKLGDDRGQAMVLNSLGGVLQRQGNFDEAVAAFQRSAEIEEQIGNQRGQAMVLNSLGGVLQRQGNFDDAVNAFQRSAEIEERIGNERGQAMVLNSLGGVLQRQGNFDGAVNAFQRSFDLLVKLGDDRSLAMVLNSLGGVLQRQGKFDDAVAAFQRSVRIGEALEDRRHLAMVYTSLGRTYHRNHEPEHAVGPLVRAFKIDSSLRNKRGVGIVTPLLVHVLMQLGRRKEAVQHLLQAIDIAPRNQRLKRLRAEIENPRHYKTGVIKNILSHNRGYKFGFIAVDDGSQDVYFREGFVNVAELSPGLRVRVATEDGPQGPRAISIITQEADFTDS